MAKTIRNNSALKGRFIKAQGSALGTHFNALSGLKIINTCTWGVAPGYNNSPVGAE